MTCCYTKGILRVYKKQQTESKEKITHESIDNNMKHNTLKSIFISLILVMGVSNAWAYNYGGANVYYYFANTASWPSVHLYIWNGGWNQDFTLTKIANTNVYYHKWSSAYNNNEGILFRGAANWNNGQTGDIKANYTSHTSWVQNNTTGKTDLSNINRQAQVAVKLSTGGDYTQTANANCVAKVSGYTVVAGNSSATAKNASTSGSSATASISAAYGSTITYTATAGTGYTFKGFSTSNSTSLPSSPSASGKTATASAYGSSNNSTYYAYFKANQYTVTYKDQGDGAFSGTHASGYPTFHTYGTATTLKTASKIGYKFEGWHTDVACTNKVSSLGATAYTANITLYAKWTADQYDITYKDQGGSTFSGAHEDGYPTQHTYGTETTLKTASKDGYTFDGWFTTSNCIGSAITSLGATAYTASITLYAKWTSNEETKYNVTAKANPVEGGNVTPTTATLMGVTSGGNITAIPNEGYAFTSWSIISGNGYFGATGSNNTSEIANTIFRPTQESTIEASFIEIKRTINILSKDENQGTVTPASTTAGVVTASTDNITAIPKEGYEFVEWTASSGITLSSTTDASTKVTKATTDGTVTAIFREKKYTINLKANNAEYGSITPPITITVGQHYASETITANPNIGYRFVNWTATDGIIIANANNASTTITAKQAGTVTANFEALPPVTIYFKPTSAWKSDNAWFAVYYWENKDGGNKKEGWLTLEDGDGHGNLYTAEIPGGYNNLIFVRLRPSTADGYTSENSGLHWKNQWEQTEDLTTPTDDKVLYDMESKNAATHLYLKPNGNWKSDGARFAACFMDDKKGNHTWKSMTINNDIYSCEIPTNKTYVIFCRMNPGNASNDWTNKWNQTGDLTIPTDGKNLFTLKDGVWDGATETWSTIYDNSKWAIYDPEENEEEQVVFLNPTGYWSNDNPTFIAHVWNNSSNEDIPMTTIGSGYYACTIPIGYHSVVFYRKSTDGKIIWNQTSDLSIPTHRANCYTIKSTGEGTTTKATGKWNEFMLMRDYHDNQKINDITGIETVNSVITFHKEMLTNNTLSVQERALYWISFPYNVNLNDAFGFGEYGTNWIIEYYDGAERAEKGCWIEDTYWKYIEEPQDVTLEAGVGYVLALDLSTLGESSPIYNGSEQISLYFPAADDIATITGGITSTHVPTHLCEINRPTDDGDRRIKDSNWNIIGVPSFANVHDFATQVGDVNFYYQWNPADDTYSPQLAATFQTMHAYMVQFAGTIDWGAKTAVSPAAIAARRNAASKDQYTLRLVLQQEGKDQDQTFIRLLAEGATNEFDMNVDLSKIINRGANIYSLIGKEEAAANVLPIEESIIPIGVDIAKAGTYTFAMPDGTDGITAILIDYETQTEHNLLTTEYTVNLNEGINNKRFAIRVVPNQVATNIESLFDKNCNQNVQKYIINGQLFIKNNGHIYDIQGREVK